MGGCAHWAGTESLGGPPRRSAGPQGVGSPEGKGGLSAAALPAGAAYPSWACCRRPPPCRRARSRPAVARRSAGPAVPSGSSGRRPGVVSGSTGKVGHKAVQAQRASPTPRGVSTGTRCASQRPRLRLQGPAAPLRFPEPKLRPSGRQRKRAPAPADRLAGHHGRLLEASAVLHEVCLPEETDRAQAQGQRLPLPLPQCRGRARLLFSRLR